MHSANLPPLARWTPQTRDAATKSGNQEGRTELTTVPDHLASCVLHMTASTILFLVKADDALADVTQKGAREVIGDETA